MALLTQSIGHPEDIPVPEKEFFYYPASLDEEHFWHGPDIVRSQPIAYRPHRRPSPMVAHQQPSFREVPEEEIRYYPGSLDDGFFWHSFHQQQPSSFGNDDNLDVWAAFMDGERVHGREFDWVDYLG